MRSFIRWLAPVAVILVLGGVAAAAETVAGGKVKSVNADKKEFVLTDDAGKDWTFKLGEDLLVNRGGKEGKSDLSAGDSIYVCYDKGVVTWTAHYVLVQDGATKTSQLIKGRFKNYDEGRKEITITDDEKNDLKFSLGKADVKVNRSDRRIDDVKIGEDVVLIVAKEGDKNVLKTVMVHRE